MIARYSTTLALAAVISACNDQHVAPPMPPVDPEIAALQREADVLGVTIDEARALRARAATVLRCSFSVSDISDAALTRAAASLEAETRQRRYNWTSYSQEGLAERLYAEPQLNAWRARVEEVHAPTPPSAGRMLRVQMVTWGGDGTNMGPAAVDLVFSEMHLEVQPGALVRIYGHPHPRRRLVMGRDTLTAIAACAVLPERLTTATP